MYMHLFINICVCIYIYVSMLAHIFICISSLWLMRRPLLHSSSAYCDTSWPWRVEGALGRPLEVPVRPFFTNS